MSVLEKNHPDHISGKAVKNLKFRNIVYTPAQPNDCIKEEPSIQYIGPESAL